MNSFPITLTTIKQLHDGQFLDEHIRVAPLRDIIGNYVEDKTERVFRLIRTITLVPFRVSRRPLIKIRHMNAITRGFVKKFTLVLNKAQISQRQFDYNKFLEKDHLVSSPKFSALIPHAGEFTINRVSELLKSDELEVQLVSFLISVIDDGLVRERTLDEIVDRLKAAAAPYPEILELIEIAHEIHGIKFYKYEFIIPRSMEVAKELVKRNPKYLKLIFCMIPNKTLRNYSLVSQYGSQHNYIICSLIESNLGVSTTKRIRIEDSNTGLSVTKLKEERDLDIPFSKGEVIASLLADFGKSVHKMKILLHDLLYNSCFVRSPTTPTPEQYEEKKKQFLARFSFSVPFPSSNNSQSRLLADYFVEAALDHSNNVNLNQSIRDQIFDEIRFLFSQGATAENAWNYVVERYAKVIHGKFEESMSEILLKMEIPIGEAALIKLLHYELNFLEIFRPHFGKDAFTRILDTVFHMKIAALDFSIVRITDLVSCISCQLSGIYRLLESGVIPSEQDISELKLIFAFLRVNNNLSYFKGRDYPKEAHRILKENQLIQEFIAKIKALINKPPAIA